MSATLPDVLAARARWVVLEGDCLEILPTLSPKSVAHVITDPPYSERVHEKRKHMLEGSGGVGGYDGLARATDLGFGHITSKMAAGVVEHVARIICRWGLFFCDSEGCHCWMEHAEAAGLEHVRMGVWVKRGATPQFTGDRPGSGFEMVEVVHRPGRKRWNGGGRHAVWTHPIVSPHGSDGRFHTTPKPVSLMLELVELFTDPGEVVLDPFAGSGTTGVACLRLGRRFIGIEKDPKYAALARERLAAESSGLTLRDARAGQLPLLGSD